MRKVAGSRLCDRLGIDRYFWGDFVVPIVMRHAGHQCRICGGNDRLGVAHTGGAPTIHTLIAVCRPCAHRLQKGEKTNYSVNRITRQRKKGGAAPMLRVTFDTIVTFLRNIRNKRNKRNTVTWY